MTLFLKQSTSIKIRLGPFMDATDAVTPEIGITLAGADQAEVLKADGVATVTMGGAFAAVTGADGWYDYTVATGDVDTVGEVVFVVQDTSVSLPVFRYGYVVEEAVYDAMYAAAAAGPNIGKTGYSVSTLATDVVSAAALATDAVNEIARAIGIQKNTAKNDIEILMIDSTDDISGKTGLTPVMTVSIDGGAFVAKNAGTTITEVAFGIYQIDANAADLNGDIITWRFTETGANDTFLTIATVA